MEVDKVEIFLFISLFLLLGCIIGINIGILIEGSSLMDSTKRVDISILDKLCEERFGEGFFYEDENSSITLHKIKCYEKHIIYGDDK